MVIISAVVVSACGGGSDSDKKKAAATTTTTTKAIPFAPLTGLPDPSGVSGTRASLAVKIENTPEARPQSGLDVADVVFEESVEGGITRFWAIFNSAAPETVGPIRSVRAMDPQIVVPFGGIVVFSGGAPANVALMEATDLVKVSENNAGSAFFREPSRSAPHNLYGRTAELFSRGGTPVPPVPQFSYVGVPDSNSTVPTATTTTVKSKSKSKSKKPLPTTTTTAPVPFTGEAISQFHVNFASGYDVTYVWDPALGWKRFSQTSTPFMSATSPPTQISVTNVIVNFIPYGGGGGDGNMIGTGTSWIFSNGNLIKGTWTKANDADITHYTDAAGAPIRITPGRTWVELLPLDKTVDVVAAPVPPTTVAAPVTTAPKAKKKK